MEILKKNWLHIVIDILHDLTAGIWPGAVIALWLARTRTEETLPPDDFAELLSSWSVVLLVMLAALAVLVATGLVRANYRALGTTSDWLKRRTRSALIKHAVFVTVYVVAAVFAFRLLQP